MEHSGAKHRATACRSSAKASSNTPEPDAAALVLKAERHLPYEPVAVEVFKEGVEEHNLVHAVERQESSQQVRLRPGAPFVYPLLRILEWVNDVVEVNIHPWTQGGQDLGEDIV